MTCKVRTLTRADVTFTLTLEEEDIPVRGNAMVSDDEETDRLAEDWVLAELERGNLAAWCCVKVTAHYNGFHGTAYLGACSYKTEAELRASMKEDYDLEEQALDDLNATIRDSASRLPAEE